MMCKYNDALPVDWLFPATVNVLDDIRFLLSIRFISFENIISMDHRWQHGELH
jgi:hypothetical protein